MNKDDLLRLLDLHGKDTKDESTSLAITAVDQLDRNEFSPTALKLDDWAVRRGIDLLAESPRLQRTKLDPLAIADFHGAAFEVEPVLQENCQDAQRRDETGKMLANPDKTTAQHHPQESQTFIIRIRSGD